MPVDLTAIYDHPASVLNSAPERGQGEHADFEKAVEVLRAYEQEHGVTFAALDNDALDAVREAYAIDVLDMTNAEAGPNGATNEKFDPIYAACRVDRLEQLESAVRDLLGLDD